MRQSCATVLSWHGFVAQTLRNAAPGIPHDARLSARKSRGTTCTCQDRDPVWNSLTFGDPNGVAMRLAGIEPAESSLHLSELVLSGCRCALSQADSQLGLGATDG
jgi:hypothetical protein